MAESSGSGAIIQVFQQQADAAISQANPVSTTLYEVLATTKNVRILSLAATITWAVTQPTPLEVVVTIDGQTLIYAVSNPVSAAEHVDMSLPSRAEASQQLVSPANNAEWMAHRGFLLEGRSVRVQARITWAVTQPSPLVCRVKYAKVP